MKNLLKTYALKLPYVPEKDIKIIREAVELHGEQNQIDLMIEECGELIVALQKLKRKKGKTTEEKMKDVQDEIADVFLMSNQVAYIFGIEAIQERIQFKIDRAYKRNEITRQEEKHTAEYFDTDRNK